MFVAQELKLLAQLVRGAALGHKRNERYPYIRKDVVRAFMSLAETHPRDGFAFSRFSRSLPRPVEVKEAAARSIELSKTEFPMSEDIRSHLKDFVSRRCSKRIVTPNVFPSSSSSCYEWPATRGGIDGYLFAVGSACEAPPKSGDPLFRIVEKRLKADDLIEYAQDSIGSFALFNAKVILEPFHPRIRGEGPGGDETWMLVDWVTEVTADINLAYRCAGFLALRRWRSLNKEPPRCKLEALPFPGMKVRVVGVPDALTYIEGDWIRRSSRMLAPGHWMIDVQDGIPGGLRHRKGSTFVSVDLSAATDGLSHDAVGAVIEGLVDGGAIRRSDAHAARRGLGLEPRTEWSYEGTRWLAKRGSPMGTPLSFIVLSWVNAWATSAFSSSRHHGDDAVGRVMASYEVEEYAFAIASCGGELNRRKTFTSESGWTMCEVAAWPSEDEGGTEVFVPPPCPPPGLRAPVAAETRCGSRYLRRQERVMRTLFPWCHRDPRLRLPKSIGGLGYLGRGLAIPVSLRRRLGTLVSRGPDYLIARGVVGKTPFTKEGLYPHPLVPVPARPKEYHLSRRLVASEPLTCSASDGGVPVPVIGLVIYENMLVESQYRLLVGDKFKRRWGGDRPARTKSKALFRRYNGPLAAPLTRKHGAASLDRWAVKLQNMTVEVFEDVAFEIRDRIPNTAQG